MNSLMTVTDRTWLAIKPVFDKFSKRGHEEVPGSALKFAAKQAGIGGWNAATSISRLIKMGVIEVARDTPVDSPGVTWRRTYRRGPAEELPDRGIKAWTGGVEEVDTSEVQKRAKSKPFTWVRLPQRLGDKGMNELEELGFEVSQVIRWTGGDEGNSEISG